jgi:hypothetical protein
MNLESRVAQISYSLYDAFSFCLGCKKKQKDQGQMNAPPFVQPTHAPKPLGGGF